MGQHKYNPRAIAAKNGELPPKPRKISKRERELLYTELIPIIAKAAEIPVDFLLGKTNEAYKKGVKHGTE